MNCFKNYFHLIGNNFTNSPAVEIEFCLTALEGSKALRLQIFIKVFRKF